MPNEVFAQGFDPTVYLPSGDASVAGKMLQLMVAVTVLSVAPGILMMVTSFTRFVIALSFLRAGLGLQTTPGNLVLVSLALFLTIFVMGPTFEASWQNGVKPMIDNKISIEQGYAETTMPFRTFMKLNVREKDLEIFKTMSKERFKDREELSDDDFRVLVPAFMTSELRRGFEIGFLIALPFIVIDLTVATVMMAMGMMMMPPTVVSMPLKVLFFVLIDGWTLLMGALTKSFV
ncbi:MAG: flagellar type III secretion system pore protein FliP [Hyphomicrobium sp.]